MERNFVVGKSRGKGRGGRRRKTFQEMVYGSDDEYNPYPHKVSGPLNENANDLIYSNSPKSEFGSSMSSSKGSGHVQESIPMDLSEDHEPQTKPFNAAISGQGTNSESTGHSFNLTEVANDNDEIESSIDHDLVDVHGYRVRPETASLLPRILEHHGDIAKDCKAKALRGCYLEKVCYVYEKLQKSTFQEITRRVLDEMGETLDELEHVGLNVEWLSKRLDDILKVKVFLKVYSKKSKEIKKGNDHLVTLQKTANSIRQNVSILEDEIMKMKDAEEKTRKARTLLNNSLIHGLI